MKNKFLPKSQKTKTLNVPITVPQTTTEEQIATLQSDLSDILSLSLEEINLLAKALKNPTLKSIALAHLKTQL